MSDSYDVIVIGGGPAGYPCAIRAAQNGLTAACIDGWKNYDGSHAFGGTCLNAGCIPSKALLESSELYHRAQSEFGAHGIKVGGLDFDLATMQKRKAKIVKASTQGIAALFKSAGVTGLVGHGRLLTGNRVEYTSPDGSKRELTAKHVVLASGSAPMPLKSVPFDGKAIVDSWGALEFDDVPKRLGVIGAGVIGLELGSVWRRLGAEVVVLEAMEQFLWMADQQVAREALKHFRKQGLDVRLGAKVGGAKTGKDGVTLEYTDASGRRPSPWTRSWSRSAAGRSPRDSSARAQASSSTSEASSRWTTSAARARRTSGRWAMRCAAPCSRTRARKRA